MMGKENEEGMGREAKGWWQEILKLEGGETRPPHPFVRSFVRLLANGHAWLGLPYLLTKVLLLSTYVHIEMGSSVRSC